MGKLRLFAGLAIISISLIFIAYISEDKTADDNLTQAEEIKEPDIAAEEEPLNFYIREGIISANGKQNLKVFEDIIRRNQNMSEILLKYNVPYKDIDKLAKAAKDIFSVRKIAEGKKYSVFYTDDSIQKAQYFIYEIDPANYVIYSLGDSIYVRRDRREVNLLVKEASGVINSSLWQSMTENNVNPGIAVELSGIYAWTVDFYRIQHGDAFKVIYEEKYVDTVCVGVGRVQAAYFKHFNDEIYAIYFEQGEIGDYFDQNAKSMRKAFLKSPLKFSRITSKYTMKRFHPVQKRWKAHLGTDYAAPTGTPIMTTGDGAVSEAGYTKNNGYYVKVKHNATYSTQYLHMTKIKNGIRRGASVRQGDVIGFVGSTGLATGPHVCYRFWKNNHQIDPFKVKIPPSEPVRASYRSEFDKLKDEMIIRLNSIEKKDVL